MHNRPSSLPFASKDTYAFDLPDLAGSEVGQLDESPLSSQQEVSSAGWEGWGPSPLRYSSPINEVKDQAVDEIDRSPSKP